MTVALGAVVQVKHQRGDGGDARLVGFSPVLQPIHQAGTGHCGGDVLDEQCVGLGEKETDRRHRRLRLKVVVRRLDGHTPFPATGEGTACDRRFGVDGYP